MKLSTESDQYYKLKDSKISAFEIEEPEKPSQYAFKFIKLNPGITQVNFVCCIIHMMIMIFGLASAGSIQPLILLDKKYYNISQEESGTITSLILVIQLVVKMIVSLPYGHYADKLGRKTVIYYGAINYLISCLLIPAQTSIFPGFILAKMLLANGLAALQTVPLLADYVADESKGIASGFAGMAFGVSAIFSNILLKILLYAEVQLGLIYVVIGVITFVILCVNTFGLKGGFYYLKEKKKNPEQQNQTSFKENLMEAFTIFKSNGWLIIALVLQIIGSSDFFIFLNFLTLYVKSLFPNEEDDTTANILVNNLQTMILIPMFFCNIFYGYFLDKKEKALKLSYFALVGGACSCLLVCFSKDPYQWTLTWAALLLGATIPGLLIITGYLNIKNFPADKRGIMIGFTSLVGNVGYFIISFGGGFLYDYWRKEAPFLICATLLTLSIVLITRVYQTKIAGKET